jgi:peptidoglycan/LPS O-acetylase OafA/YrhL
VVLGVTQKNSRKRLIEFDLVRSFVVLMVVGFHVHLICRTTGNSTGWLVPFFECGISGIYQFFFMSGFLISRMVDLRSGLFEMDWRDFYIRRFARVLPLYFAVLILSLAILKFPLNTFNRLIYERSSLVFDPAFLASLLFFQVNWYRIFVSLHQGMQWDIIWSLSVEEQFYLFFPLLFWRAQNPQGLGSRLLKISILGLGITGVLLFFGINYERVYFSTSFAFSFFALGIWFYVWIRNRQFSWTRKERAFLISSYPLLLIVRMFFESNPDLTGLGYFVETLALMAFFLGARDLRWGPSRLLWILAAPGRWIYGVYMLHPFVIYLLMPFLGSSLLRNVLAVYALLIPLAGISYHYFEVPANRAFQAFARRFFPLTAKQRAST